MNVTRTVWNSTLPMLTAGLCTQTPKILFRRYHQQTEQQQQLPIKKNVRVFDTSARDGLQALPDFVSTAVKIQFINMLGASGLEDIEMTSVSKLQQIADAEAVFKGVIHYPGVRHWVLIANQYGLERVLEWGGSYVGLMGSVSEAFSIANTRKGMDETFQERHLPILRQASLHHVAVRTYLSCVFGFRSPNDVEEEEIIEQSHRYAALSDRVVLCDTTKLATNERVHQIIDRVISSGVPAHKLAVHLHGPADEVIQKVRIAIDLGIEEIDTSLSGLGGCPAAKKTRGIELTNAPTEDVVRMIEELNFETRVNLERLKRARSYILDNI